MKHDIIQFLNKKSDDDWDTIIEFLISCEDVMNVDESFLEQYDNKDDILKVLKEHNLYDGRYIGSLITAAKYPIESSIFRQLKNLGCVVLDSQMLGKYYIKDDFHVLYLNGKSYNEVKYFLLDDTIHCSEEDMSIAVAEPPRDNHQYIRHYWHIPNNQIIVGKCLHNIGLK